MAPANYVWLRAYLRVRAAGDAACCVCASADRRLIYSLASPRRAFNSSLRTRSDFSCVMVVAVVVVVVDCR